MIKNCKVCKTKLAYQRKTYCSRVCQGVDTKVHKICIGCGMERNRWSNKYCSKVCQGKNTRAEKSQNWDGDSVGYCGIHDWLTLHFGKANKCESKKCKKISKRFEWAKIKGKKYERKRENFKQLCKSCHSIYDCTGKTRKKLRERIYSLKTRRKISRGLKAYFKKHND